RDTGNWEHTYVYDPVSGQMTEAAADPTGKKPGRVGLGPFPGFLYIPDLKGCLLVAMPPQSFKKEGGPAMITWLFDAITGTWRDLAPGGPPLSARFGMGFSYDRQNKIVVLFGGATPTTTPEALDDTWIYDPVRNLWISLESESSPRIYYAAERPRTGDCQM